MLLVLALLVAAPDIQGFDRPDLEVTWTIGKSEYTDGAVRVTCNAHPSFAVIETNDPGHRGAAHEVRDRRAAMSAHDVCARDFAGTSRQLTSQDRYLLGARGRFLLLRGGDSFGAHQPITVVDAPTGEVRLETVRWEPSRATLSSSPDGLVVLELVVGLDMPCDLVADPAACFTRVRQVSKVPHDVTLAFSPKRCAIRSGARQLGISARYDDLSRPAIRYLGGEVLCALSP